MNWSTNGGSPTQLEFEGKLYLKAAEIASLMNRLFIDKVSKIRNSRESIPNSSSSQLQNKHLLETAQ